MVIKQNEVILISVAVAKEAELLFRTNQTGVLPPWGGRGSPNVGLLHGRPLTRKGRFEILKLREGLQ